MKKGQYKYWQLIQTKQHSLPNMLTNELGTESRAIFRAADVLFSILARLDEIVPWMMEQVAKLWHAKKGQYNYCQLVQTK